MTGAMLNLAACFILKPFHALYGSPHFKYLTKGRWAMLNREILTKEVGDLEMLISAVSSEIADHQSLNDPSQSANELLKEMREAVNELKLARGVRLMLLNAFDTSSRLSAIENRYDLSSRRPARPLRRAS